jgi:hypothetical protein
LQAGSGTYLIFQGCLINKRRADTANMSGPDTIEGWYDSTYQLGSSSSASGHKPSFQQLYLIDQERESISAHAFMFSFFSFSYANIELDILNKTMRRR